MRQWKFWKSHEAVDMICILHHHLLIQIDVLDHMPNWNNAIHDCLGKPVLKQTGHNKITEYFWLKSVYD
jgi:hypothetical protein